MPTTLADSGPAAPAPVSSTVWELSPSDGISRPRRAATIALAGAALTGTLAEGALRSGPPGAGLTLAALLLLCTAALARDAIRPAPAVPRSAFLLPALFALLLAARSSSALVVLNAGALALSLALLSSVLSPERRWPLPWANPRRYLRAVGEAAAGALVGAPRLAAEGCAGGGRAVPALRAVLRAASLAAPVVVLFTLLLASADPVFAAGIRRLMSVDLGAVAWHSAVAAGLAWAAAGWLRTALLPGRPGGSPPRAHHRLATTDVVVLLGALDLLFAAFVLVQLRHLFGGAALVGATPGLTFAEYARRGFFELVAVTALAVPLLLATHAGLPRVGSARRAFRRLAAPMVGLLLVVVISALRRMQLYQAEFGLTLARVVATALMLWVATVLAIFAVTVLRGRARGFAWRSLLAGAVALVALNGLDPEALIVRTNVRRAAEGHALDLHYLTRLSPDAAPALAASLPALAPFEACEVRNVLRRAMRPAGTADRGGWQSWTVAGHRARSIAGRVRATPAPEPCAQLRTDVARSAALTR